MELKEKWNLKEGWCWNDDKSEAIECVFIKELLAKEYKFLCKIINLNVNQFKNFSETDPSQEELKVGEFAYFWDDGDLEVTKTILYSVLLEIDDTDTDKYKSNLGSYYQYCSHINPLLK